MYKIEFLQLIKESVNLYQSLPIPAIISDLEMNVYWSNEPARRDFTQLAEHKGMHKLLSEFNLRDLVNEVTSKGNVTIEDVIPLSGIRISMLPLRDGSGSAFGILILLINSEIIPTAKTAHNSSKTAAALSGTLQTAVSDMFGIMDLFSVKADMMDVGWIKHSFSHISRYCYKILRVSGNMALYSRYQSGFAALKPKTLDICAMVEQYREMVELMAESMSIPISFSLPKKRCFVEADTHAMELVLFNILHNSMYFTRPGNKIEVKVREEQNNISLTVKDKGAGISKSDLPHVFRPYASFCSPGMPPSLGLGLTLCKLVTESQNGYMTIKSRKNIGTTIGVTLPKSSFSCRLPLAQKDGGHTSTDRFSVAYVGLMDASLSPYREHAEHSVK